MDFPMEAFFDEPYFTGSDGTNAEIEMYGEIKPITVIADFNIEMETADGYQAATGYTGIFDVSKEVYDFAESGKTTFNYDGKRFLIIQKKPVNSGVYQVVAEA